MNELKGGPTSSLTIGLITRTTAELGTCIEWRQQW